MEFELDVNVMIASGKSGIGVVTWPTSMVSDDAWAASSTLVIVEGANGA